MNGVHHDDSQRARKRASYAAAAMVVMAAFYTLYLAQSLFVPIVLAMLLHLLLSPIVRRLHRLGIPYPIGATVTLAALLLSLFVTVQALWTPASQWVSSFPRRWDTVEYKLRELRQPLDQLRATSREVERLTDIDGEEPNVQRVVPAGPRPMQIMFDQSWQVVVGALVTVVLLFLLLASGESFMRKLVAVTPQLSDKKRAVRIVRTMEDRISRYLVTVTLINASLGLAVGVAMWLLDLPNPALWGALAFALNYVPYAGPTVGIILLALASLITFDQPWAIALPPLSYLGLNIVEAYFVTPTVLGHSLSLSPAVVFLAVVVWSWLWGVVGAFIAIPMLVATKVVCDAIEALQPIGAFLGDVHPE